MRRLLPLALLLAACAKPADAPKAASPAPKAVNTAGLTPEGVAKAADVPFYPGAEAPENMSTMPERQGDGSTHYSLVLATSDSPAKVAAWYAGKTGLETKTVEGGETIIGKTPGGNDLIVRIAPEAGRTLIKIKSIAYAR